MIVDCKNSEFSLDNIPFGIISTSTQPPRPATAIGDYALDLHLLAEAGLFDGPLLSKVAKSVFAQVFYLN